jgi:ABC-type thiamine transport system substrate-binding protein
MEYQQQVAVTKDQLLTLFDLMNEYSVRKIFIIDPDAVSIGKALSHLDPDQVVAGGYCREECGDYWKKLTEDAVYWK